MLFDSDVITDLNNPFSQLSLHRTVLDIVNAYIGVCSKILSLTLAVTMPVKKEADPSQSQRWHRDPDDRVMCKMFLYLNDVGETAGPFMYVSQSQYGGRYRHIFPQKLPSGFYPPLGAVERRIPKKDIKVFTGKAGTIVFADTSGLHKGGYATGKERIMFTTSYVSNASLWPPYYTCPDSEDFKKQLALLHPVVQYALEER